MLTSLPSLPLCMVIRQQTRESWAFARNGLEANLFGAIMVFTSYKKSNVILLKMCFALDSQRSGSLNTEALKVEQVHFIGGNIHTHSNHQLLI